jgi:endoglucanase
MPHSVTLQNNVRRAVRILLAVVSLALLQGQSEAQQQMPWLSASGTNIADSTGKIVPLRGINLGGGFEVEPWMSALNLSSPSSSITIQDEFTLWEVLQQRFGLSEMQQLQQTWRSSWLTPSDIAQVASMGANVVRIPFYYQLVQDDSNPNQLIPEGIALLDALVAACAQNGVYAILDLHGAPGGQSSNFTTGQAGQDQLFSNGADQQQTIELWSLLAAHYQNHPEVAGYDLLNEPSGATVSELIDLHNRIYQAIRAVDTNHMIIMEDGYLGFGAFPQPSQMGWTNICYSLHIYHLTALTGNPWELDITSAFPQYQQQLQGLNTPFYIGEFSTDATLISRATSIGVLPGYLSALDATGWSWTPWSYKIFDPTDGTDKLWGVYTNNSPWNQPDPYNDSSDVLQQKFSNYVTSNIQVQSDLRSVLATAFSSQVNLAPTINAVVNGASFLAGTASATWTTIEGTNLSQVTASWQLSDFINNQLPTMLDGVSVSIDGIPAYVAYVSPSQINVLAPDDSALGSVTVQVTNSAGTATAEVEKEGFSPAFFTFPGNYVAAVHANGTLVAPAGLFLGGGPAQPGENVELYGTGFGPTNPPVPTGQIVSQPEPTANQVTVSIGGVNSQVTFEGLVGPGLYQFNATIPVNTPNGDAIVTATVQGQSSPNVKIPVQQ